jgi:hypothetical protein
MVGGLDVIAEALVVLAERVDVVAADLSCEEKQRRQRHECRLAGLVRSLQLHPAVGVPDLGAVVFPQVHHASAERLPAVGAHGLRQPPLDGGDAPRRELVKRRHG